jgi:hypothetical protein
MFISTPTGRNRFGVAEDETVWGKRLERGYVLKLKWWPQKDSREAHKYLQNNAQVAFAAVLPYCRKDTRQARKAAQVAKTAVDTHIF